MNSYALLEFIVPDWPAAPHVRALSTTRNGGFSQEPYASLNLGDHVGDDPLSVARNRALLRAHLPGEPAWLRQVHGTVVVNAAAVITDQEADAVFARRAGLVCAVLTADCLPVLFCDRAGSVVAAAHAGWRGLAAGVLEQTVAAMTVDSAVAPAALIAWLGPAIGPRAFEVGDDVRAAFVGADPAAAAAFIGGARGKYRVDLYALARLRLSALGIGEVFGGECCTYSEADTFFSHRRDGVSGRMSTLIWLEAQSLPQA